MGRTRKRWLFLKDWNHVNINTGEPSFYKKGHIVTNAIPFCYENGVSTNFFTVMQYRGLVRELKLTQIEK